MNEKKDVESIGRIWLYLTVFLTGAAVMVIELLGTRLIAPFYGASLYVWSSLISVTMMALAVGYFIGGRWADSTRRTGLASIIALAALLILLIPWTTRPILLATDPLGLRLGAFVSALALFFPSLALLGMVGPFAIKLSTARLEGVGNSAGSIYAVSTVGSVAGTLALGFFLFPRVGSREVFLGQALVLFLLSILLGIQERKRLGLARAVLPGIFLGVIGLGLLPQVVDAGHGHRGGDKFRIRYERESLYGWVRVIDDTSRNLRLLTSDASVIGAASITTGESMLSYQDIVGLIPALRPGMKRALIVGLGAGHMAEVLYQRYSIRSDALEIDPSVAAAATDYFSHTPRGKVIVGDARYEIRHLRGPYDLIIHDCFTGGSEPAHLLTVETLAQLRGLLAEQGVLAVNFVAYAQGPHSAVLAAVARTLAQVLPQQSAFISEPGKEFTDFIFLASRAPLDLQAQGLLPHQVSWLRERVFPLDSRDGVLLTDDLNPLEHLQIAKAEHYRRFLVDLFGAELFVP